jgi:hypothetical protein
MNENNRRGPPRAGEAPHTPEDKPLDDIMEELGDDTLVGTNPYGAPNLVKTRDIVGKTQEKFGTSLLPGGKLADIPEVVGNSCQLWGYRLGALPKMVLFRRPAYAKDLLVPAMQSVFKAAPLLWREARAVLEGIDVEGSKTTTDRLLIVRKIKAKVWRFYSALDALESNLEVELDGTARKIWDRVSSLMDNEVISDTLSDLEKLFSQSPQLGLETKKIVEKTRAEDGQHPPVPPQPPPAGTPPPTPPPPTGTTAPPAGTTAPPAGTPPAGATPGHTTHTTHRKK